MPDTRTRLRHEGPSLMNQPTPEFRGPGASLYGDRGPKRSYGNLGRRREGPPQSIADHVDDALKHIAGLTPKQRLAVHNEICRMLRDIEVIRLVAHSVRGPYSEAAVQDEGRPL
jgi:hypothetical protein